MILSGYRTERKAAIVLIGSGREIAPPYASIHPSLPSDGRTNGRSVARPPISSLSAVNLPPDRSLDRHLPPLHPLIVAMQFYYAEEPASPLDFDNDDDEGLYYQRDALCASESAAKARSMAPAISRAGAFRELSHSLARSLAPFLCFAVR